MSGGTDQLPLVLVLTGVALVPLLLVMITSYAKIAVVLHILRGALGAGQIPPALVLTGLALLLTAVIMAPTALTAYEAARPELNDEALARPLSPAGVGAMGRAALKARGPVMAFLQRNSDDGERALFLKLANRGMAGQTPPAAKVDENHPLVLLPAFVVGQLRTAFLIGFLLFIPFLVVDLLVANVLLALGMNMLAPAAVALPFKLLLFVLADGWSLLSQGLVLSYV